MPLFDHVHGLDACDDGATVLPRNLLRQTAQVLGVSRAASRIRPNQLSAFKMTFPVAWPSDVRDSEAPVAVTCTDAMHPGLTRHRLRFRLVLASLTLKIRCRPELLLDHVNLAIDMARVSAQCSCSWAATHKRCYRESRACGPARLDPPAR